MNFLKGKQIIHFLILFILIITAVSCSITGKTSKFHVMLPLDWDKKAVNIEVASVKKEPGGSVVQGMQVFTAQGLTDQDISVVKAAFIKTIEIHKNQVRAKEGDSLKIYVLFRSYTTASDSKQIAVLASIAWCAAYSKDEIVFNEEFFATGYKKSKLATHGKVKNIAHKAIVKRVCHYSYLLAQLSPEEDNYQLPPIKNTYLEIKEAVKILPKSMEYSTTPIQSSSSQKRVKSKLDLAKKTHELSKKSTSKNEDDEKIVGLQWDWVKPPNQIDWYKYIEKEESENL